ncbi:MAG TPA: peptidylprolyl isomerase [Actinotalea sp.]
MSSSKREREYARKRHEKWLARQAALRVRRRRRQVLIGAVVGALVLIGAIALVINLTRDSTPAAAAPSSPAATPSSSAAAVPDPSLAEGRTWTSTLTTTAGDIALELDGKAAPQAVASFVTLAQKGFFDGTTCHRLTVEGIFVLQCGDPTGTGTGGPGYSFGPIENAPADGIYPAGTVAMARTADDAASQGSQFFLVYKDSPIPSDSAGGYTVFGHITGGMDVLQAVADAGIAKGTDSTPATEVTIKGVETQ